MTLKYEGRISIGEAMPLAVVVNANLGEAIAAALGEIEAHIAGLLNVQAALTITLPGFAATLEGLALVTASLRATGPTATLQIDAVDTIIAGLRLQVAALQAMVKFPLGGSLHLYEYSGPASACGAELGAATAGGFPGGAPTDQTTALILASVDAETLAIFRIIFKKP